MNDVPRLATLSRDEFAERFLRAGQPVIITNDLATWAGTSEWTFESLRRRWGHHTVSAFVTREGELDHASERQPVLFSYLIDAVLQTAAAGLRISGPQLDLKLNVPWAAEHVSLPRIVPTDRVESTNLWLQAAGDKTHLHWDEDPGVLGLLHGEKEIALFEPAAWRSLYPNTRANGANWSSIDYWQWDDAVFPRFRDARAIRTTLRAGEMLFVPQTWWHCVHTTQPSIALNCWWSEPEAEVGEAYRRLVALSRL